MGKRIKRFRLIVQSSWTLITNGYLIGFIQGKIYTGKIKNICVPGLNCYSCPGSFGSCPIGSLQAVLGSGQYQFSFYLLSFFLILGTAIGRLVCGFLCPFGLIQELLNKIPFLKKITTFRGDHILRLVKYIILAVFVVLLPLLVVDAAGNGFPWFCKWICPAGTLEGGIPLLITNPMLREAAGYLFMWKVLLLIVTIIISIMIYRPFCKYICPLGAVYALFNRISIYRYTVDKSRCNNCRQCEQACPMNIKPQEETNNPECIRCGQCQEVCLSGAISSGFEIKPVYANKSGEEAVEGNRK